MTFTEIVTSVGNRLNLTSATAVTRIGTHVNKRYKRLVSSMNLDTSVRARVSALSDSGIPYLTFSCQKILAVYDASVTPVRMLGERSVDELRNLIGGSDPADLYAIYLMGATTVQILLNSGLNTGIHTFTADVIATSATLSGMQVPAFSENFHDILETGAMADELMKMEKPDLSQAKELEYESRCSELRLFIAKSAYLDIYQGKTRQGRSWRTTVPLV